MWHWTYLCPIIENIEFSQIFTFPFFTMMKLGEEKTFKGSIFEVRGILKNGPEEVTEVFLIGISIVTKMLLTSSIIGRVG